MKRRKKTERIKFSNELNDYQEDLLDRFPKDKVFHCFNVWIRDPRLKVIMQELHCNVMTAKQVLEQFRFVENREIIRNKLRLETEKKWLDVSKEWINILRGLKRELLRVMAEIGRMKLKEQAIVDIDTMICWTEQLTRVADKMARLEAWLYGEPDLKMEVHEKEFEGWTIEEKLEYAKTGKRPERFYGKEQDIIDISVIEIENDKQAVK